VPTSAEMPPDLDQWLPNPALRVAHARTTPVDEARLWQAAREVRLRDAALLGRLVRWRIPGTRADISFDELFRNPPFLVLDGGADQDRALICGLVGRIWTIRRDYPQLTDPDEFRAWSKPGTAKALFANWVERAEGGESALVSESRVLAIGRQGRVGVTAVKPLVAAFQQLIASDGIEAAIRLANER